MSTISYDQFDAVDIRAGKIPRVEDFPKARQPAYKIWIDFGDMGEKKSSAKLTKLYRKEQLLGKTVLAVVNFAPLQVADFMSEVLVLGVPDENGEVVLLCPDKDVPINAQVISLPDRRAAVINDIVLRRGDYFGEGRRNEVIVSEKFAQANAIAPGSTIRRSGPGRRRSRSRRPRPRGTRPSGSPLPASTSRPSPGSSA